MPCDVIDADTHSLEIEVHMIWKVASARKKANYASLADVADPSNPYKNIATVVDMHLMRCKHLVDSKQSDAAAAACDQAAATAAAMQAEVAEFRLPDTAYRCIEALILTFQADIKCLNGDRSAAKSSYKKAHKNMLKADASCVEEDLAVGAETPLGSCGGVERIHRVQPKRGTSCSCHRW